MNEKQFKQQSHDLIINIASTIGTFTTSLKLTDDDLARTQKLVKKFDETLAEFIDSRKPKFKVGDYVAYEGDFDTYVTELKTLIGAVNLGVWFSKSANELQIQHFVLDRTFRHATPEEIAEYKAALNFHEHGRKPFEVKEGDLVKTPSGKKQIVAYPNVLTKLDFANGWELLKTAEELDKWLGTADE